MKSEGRVISDKLRLLLILILAAAALIVSASFAYAEEEDSLLPEDPGTVEAEDLGQADTENVDTPEEPEDGATSDEAPIEESEPVEDGQPEEGLPDTGSAEESDDALITGFVTEGGVTRYYDENGVLVTLSWIADPETGKTYFALEDGTIAAGRFLTFGSELYYALENGEIASGIFSALGSTYYAAPDTLAVKRSPGWVEENGESYYILTGGKAATGFLTTEGALYYLDGSGRLLTGFFEAGGQLRYSDPETGIVLTKVGWLEVDGERYYISAGGPVVRNMFISFGDYGFFMGSDGRLLRTAEEIKEGYGLIYVVRNEDGEIPLGWYTDPEGERYYQGRSGVLRGDVTMEGRKYRFDAETGKLVSMVGIDVSEWQGNINWNQVAADGVDLAMIRLGGRFGGSGALFADDEGISNLRGAINAGLHVGVYFYTQAVTVAEAREEARYMLAQISGLDVDFPIVIDTEEMYGGGRHNYISPSLRTSIVLAFCDEITKAGYTPMVYTSASYFEDWWLQDSRLDGILHWVAEIYGNPDAHNSCSYDGETACWQYSWEGSVRGINGDVDMNIWYLDVWDPRIKEVS